MQIISIYLCHDGFFASNIVSQELRGKKSKNIVAASGLSFSRRSLQMERGIKIERCPTKARLGDSDCLLLTELRELQR